MPGLDSKKKEEIKEEAKKVDDVVIVEIMSGDESDQLLEEQKRLRKLELEKIEQELIASTPSNGKKYKTLTLNEEQKKIIQNLNKQKEEFLESNSFDSSLFKDEEKTTLPSTGQDLIKFKNDNQFNDEFELSSTEEATETYEIQDYGKDELEKTN